MNHPASLARSRRVLVLSAWLLLCVAFASAAGAVTLHGQQQTTVAIATATPLSAGDVTLGAVPAGQKLHIVVSLNLRHKVQLDAFVARATNLATPLAQRRMAPGVFLANYAPTAAQAAQVAAFLTAKGFTQVTIAPNRLLVSGYAHPTTVEAAFDTTLRQVRTARGEMAYANIAAAHIPATLKGTIQGVLGLQTVHHPHTLSRFASPNVQGGHLPTGLPKIYNADGLSAASDVSVGIITAGDMTPVLSDFSDFLAANSSLPSIDIHVVPVGSGCTSQCTAGTGEWDLDSQSIVGMAGDLKHLVLYAADSMSFGDLTMAMNAAVNDTTYQPQVVNMSFGGCEGPGSATTAEANVMTAAVAAGITFAASSGDEGANCNKTGTFGVEDPASQPNVVAVGGTTLDTDSNGNYQSESAWSCTGNGCTGGGVSTFEPKPTWQTTQSGNFRGVPDVAFDGDPSTGVQIYVNGSAGCCYGGTSLSSPIFVGAWARLLQSNPGLTFAAPYLYNNLTASDYHDVTSGNNITSQSSGLYSAGTGWDNTTGFGSFNVAQVDADLGAPGAPSVAKAFAPNQIAPQGTSTLTISLSNASQPTLPATLLSDFSDRLPSGVMVAATPNASTTCSGSLIAPASSSTVTLQTGASIPAAGSCTISVDVTAPGTGTYVNTIATGALNTSNGINALPAQATLTVGSGASTPVASVSPGALDFSASGSQTLTIANTGGGSLSYSFAEAAFSSQHTLHTNDAYNFQVDDGSIEQADALTNQSQSTEYAAIWLNRFPVVGPLTINSVSIYWPSQTDAGGILTSKQPTLLVYYDADGDGNPGNAVQLDSEQVSITSQGAPAQTYTVSVAVPGAGDVYIGFSDSWANGGTTPFLKPVAEDTSTPQGQSLLVFNDTGAAPDLGTLSNNNSVAGISANLMIRASGTSTYTSANCSTPSGIPWLSETPTSGSLLGGHSDAISVTTDTTGLANGNYSALLCATTNDTAHSLIAVPVTLAVNSTGPVNQPPVANFTYVANGLAVTFTDTSSDSDGTVAAWAWDFGDGSPVSTVQNPSHTYALAGNYTVSLTVTDNDSAASAPTTQALTLSLLPPTLATSFAPTTIPLGHTSLVTLTFGNGNATDATLTATFRDNLPSGLTTVAGTVATTCGGSNPPTQTTTRFTLPNHSTIPANATCTMTGEVTAAATGSYANALAAGALKTDAGDGPAASATLTVTPAVPVAVVTPNALAFAVPIGGSASRAIRIANQGLGALNWSIAQAAPMIRLHVVRDQRFSLERRATLVPQATLDAVSIGSGIHVPPHVLGVPAGTLPFQDDYGFYNNRLGLGSGNTEFAGVYLNRFAPAAGTAPFTVNTISVLWPSQSAGSVLGQQARLLAYYDADGDGDPSNALFLGQSLVSIDTVNTFQTYHVSFDVPGAGDIYVGFEDAWAEQDYTPRLYPAALDTAFPNIGAAYVYGMADGSPPYMLNLANNSLGSSPGGNLLIRATGTKDGGPTANCVNPSLVPWLTESSTSGTVAASANSDVTISVDSTGMPAGSYSALLCVATNDPLHDVVEVPVGMTVAACGPADRIFADGFDGTGCTLPLPTIVSGDINQTLQGTGNGLTIDLTAGTWSASAPPTGDSTDDLYLYNSGVGPSVYWFGDVVPAAVGGVVDASFSFAVLQGGDTVGPGIAFSPASTPLNLWLAGQDGYLGIAFWNETTSQLDYGYIRVITTGPGGFPLQVENYGYNADGGPIQIPQ